MRAALRPLCQRSCRIDLTTSGARAETDVRSLGGLFDITNNFVFANGNDLTGEFGGMRLETTLAGARVAHNTITMNDSDPTHSPLFAGGLYCEGASAPNNLIDGNFAGSQTQPNAQFGGTCALGNSLVSDGSMDMHYVAKGGVGPMAGGNYHLADSASPAVNVGSAGTVDGDIDGDRRDDGSPDVGADEFKR